MIAEKPETPLSCILGITARTCGGVSTCYEGGLSIPLLVRWPDQIVPQIREELVSTIDLLPTLLTAAQAHPVEGVPGRAWQPLFKPGHVSWRSHLFAEYHMHAANNFFLSAWLSTNASS